MGILEINTLFKNISSLEKAFYYEHKLVLEGQDKESLTKEFQTYVKQLPFKVDKGRCIIRKAVPVPLTVSLNHPNVLSFYNPLQNLLKVYYLGKKPLDLQIPLAISKIEYHVVTSQVWWQILKAQKAQQAETLLRKTQSTDLSMVQNSYGTLEFGGAARQVGASAFLLETNTKSILLDCGIGFGAEKLPVLSRAAAQIDLILLSHSHVDHAMAIPVLVRQGFKGEIYATQATLITYYLMGKETLSIEKNLCLFSEEDLFKSLSLFQVVQLNKPIEMEAISVVFKAANHCLGSTMVEINLVKKRGLYKLLYTGDYKNEKNQTFYKGIAGARKYDLIISEGTYGATNQRTSFLDEKDRLNELFQSHKDHVILVPVFSNRAVQFLYYMNQYYDNQLWKRLRIPVAIRSYLDVTWDCKQQLNPKISKELVNFKSKVNQIPVFNGRDFLQPGAIYVTPSGMLEGGSSTQVFMKIAQDASNLIIFTGFLSKNTLGAEVMLLKDGTYLTTKQGLKVKVLAKKTVTRSLSAHSNYSETLDLLKSLSNDRTKFYLVHGEENALLSLKKRLVQDGLKVNNIKVPYQRARDRLF